MKRPEFTTEQMDWICYQIGDWYINWKECLIDWNAKEHRLGYAKELLKEMICGNPSQFDNQEIKPNEQIISAMNKHIAEISLLVGYTHGSIAELMREHGRVIITQNRPAFDALLAILQHLNKEVSRIWYDEELSIAQSAQIVEAAMICNAKLIDGLLNTE